MIRRSRRLTLVLAALAALIGLALVTAAPADAGSRHSRSLSYVALGDSYAAGFGAGKYVNDCGQSRRGYPALLDRETRASLRSNADLQRRHHPDGADHAAVALSPRTQLITLTVGGNDLGFVAVATACAAGPSVACQAAIDAALALLAPQPTGPSVLATRLAATYGAVATAAPRADILVTGYPYPVRAAGPGSTERGRRAGAQQRHRGPQRHHQGDRGGHRRRWRRDHATSTSPPGSPDTASAASGRSCTPPGPRPCTPRLAATASTRRR